MASCSERLDVVVALITDASGRVLVSRRLPGRHMAGFWEFPGGKRARREGRREALERELDEELGIRLLAAAPFMRLDHDYPETRVALDVWIVSAYTGEPRAREGQELEWIEPAALNEIDLLPADRPIVVRLAEATAETDGRGIRTNSTTSGT
jgi:8-oxo-dGTP diphosphatase